MVDKARRKQIRDEFRLKVREEFEASLPMSRDKFSGLFDNLDATLQKEICKDDHSLTIWFLNLIGVDNPGDVVSWLIANNGFCDCEILANVEDQFNQ
ncbi:DUF2695 domain-containing protein [Pedobacter sp. AW31-3R]|uniref:DUF2695 domain-containing protein n=1 Tax=Pedobacter sp. AW31-3R TaxID=3445781 RepID=UPI003FA096C6